MTQHHGRNLHVELATTVVKNSKKNDRQRSALLLLCFNDESALLLHPYRQLVPVTSPHLAGGGPGGGSSVFGGWQRGHWDYM